MLIEPLRCEVTLCFPPHFVLSGEKSLYSDIISTSGKKEALSKVLGRGCIMEEGMSSAQAICLLLWLLLVYSVLYSHLCGLPDICFFYFFILCITCIALFSVHAIPAVTIEIELFPLACVCH